MNKVSRKTEYALMALKLMAQKRPGELTSAKEIASQTGCSFDVVAQVMRALGQHELLRSEQGPQGGYSIVRDLQRVSVLELMEMIEGPVSVAKCLHENAQCELQASCNIQSPIETLNRKLTDFYRDLKVAELLKLRGAG